MYSQNKSESNSITIHLQTNHSTTQPYISSLVFRETEIGLKLNVNTSKNNSARLKTGGSRHTVVERVNQHLPGFPGN